jgi:signal transduction histidine kinase
LPRGDDRRAGAGGYTAAFALLAILLPAIILAGLGYVSLRQWETTADALFRAQARDMAAMAAEKVRMVLARTEDETLQQLQATLERDGPRPDALREGLARVPLVEQLYLFDARGRLVFPAAWAGEDADVVDAVRTVVAEAAAGRLFRRYLRVGGRVVLATSIASARGDRMVAGIVRNPDALRRDVIEKALDTLEGPAVLAVLDHGERPVYARQPLRPSERVVTVALGEELPAWQLALYQRAELSPRAAVRRQITLFSLALGLLLVVIAAGLLATYRLVRRETQMAQLKADFVASVSHDLKTPLSLIRMFAETLELGRVPEGDRQREYYQVIVRESERLSRLIDNVLDFSRIERGRRRYDIVPTAVGPVVQEAVDAFGHVLAQNGFTVETTLPPDLPDVPMDGDAITQALANLIDNAIKFSGPRKVLRVAAEAGAGRLAITVADEGIGIPREEHARIFDKFYRVGRSDTQGRRGSGVGLALVRHIVRAHGGDVSVASEPGRGSRFTLWLPLAPPR